MFSFLTLKLNEIVRCAVFFVFFITVQCALMVWHFREAGKLSRVTDVGRVFNVLLTR